MKIIDMIKEQLGLDAKDLDKDIDLKTVKQMQTHLDDLADAIIEKESEERRQAEQKANEETAKRIHEARVNSRNKYEARKKLRHMQGISPARLMRLRKEGKL
mgnify:CR=1 FL=1